MSKDYEEMNQCEKKSLIEASKNSLKNVFNHMTTDDWDSFFQSVKNTDMLNAMILLLDAKHEIMRVQCSFKNHYIDSSDMHRFLIYGEEIVPLNYDNVLAIFPSDRFEYLYKGEDITDSFVTCIDMLGVDSYLGKILYAGIINEESPNEGFADLNNTELINETEVYMIDEQSAIWKRYFAESYRLFESEQYKLAFLHSFIGFESLIEYLNEILYNVYLNEQNEIVRNMFEYYNTELWTPINLIEKNILISQAYQRLKHLEDENRKLIKDKLSTIFRYVNDLENNQAEKKINDFLFFEKLRNVLAHGDSLERDDLKEDRLYQKYYDKMSNTLDFELVYIDFFNHIGTMIKELIN